MVHHWKTETDLSKEHCCETKTRSMNGTRKRRVWALYGQEAILPLKKIQSTLIELYSICAPTS